jgi:hypothetical protein
MSATEFVLKEVGSNSKKKNVKNTLLSKIQIPEHFVRLFNIGYYYLSSFDFDNLFS